MARRITTSSGSSATGTVGIGDVVGLRDVIDSRASYNDLNAEIAPIAASIDTLTQNLNKSGIPNWVSGNASHKVFDANALGHKIMFVYASDVDLDNAGLTLKPFDAPRDTGGNLYWAMTATRDPISWHESLGPYLRPDVHVVQHLIGTTINEYHISAALDPAEYTTEPQNLAAKYKLKLTYAIA